MVKGRYYVGLDPSLAAFGITIIDTTTQTIILDQIKSENHHNFVFMSWSIVNMYNDFIERYKEIITAPDTYIAQEAPISAGINAGKLNALGMYFYANLGALSSYKKIRTYHPMKLKSFHHKKGYKKKDTIEVVEKLLDYFESIGYTVKVVVSRTKKNLSITDGEADSFIYAVKTYLDNREGTKAAEDILKLYPRFEVITSLEEKMIEYAKEK